MKLCIFSSAGDQGLAVELQKFELAVTQEESSILPALINFISGFSSTKEIRGDPHSSQNPLETFEPAEPVTVKNLRLPFTFNELSGINSIVALPLPVLYLQSTQ